jgi:hypothetical protein
MILRAMALGFALWLINAAVFRFLGPYFFYPDIAPPYALFGGVVVWGALITFALLKLLRAAPGDEGEAALSVAFPSLLLNAFITYQYAEVFPNLDPALDGVYGGLAMLYAASMAFTGLMMTRLAPQDERI